MVGPGRPQFVLFGSSIVQMCYNVGGWGAILADLYARKADVVLRGYSGWNTRMALEILEKVFPKDAAVQPSLVVLYFGGNDATNPHPSGLGAHVPLPEFVENMKKMIVHIKSLSDKTRIICLTSPPVNEAKVREIFGDGIHLSAEGCKIVVKEILKVLKKEPSLYWLSMPAEFSEDSPYYVVGPDGKTTFNVSGHVCTWQKEWLDI
ncbi:GDSL esterase/lipase cprd49 [Phtheirospermum japonicum]|uniref:GDSL esterase/lipase cprd49 n=1 Tax=Phtheirospermum japonicum TaxID=374723 RepID=A0A830C846_9LAMI|nr:GDSL esterase/lipase cprd49 [Phtheirospermum japonicum]